MTGSATGAPSVWSEFLEALDLERAASTPPQPVRALAEEFAIRTITLLFPQFDRATGTPGSVLAQGEEVLALLRRAIAPLVADPDAVVAAFAAALPAAHSALRDDVHAILAGDPAAETKDEVILAYPGFFATVVHRISHELYRLRVPVFPRIVSEWAHRETGIDIHPGARIGRAFAIDHGTGIVIGETSIIGDRVRMYQGVTLGALAVSKGLANTKRHPTIGNDVVLYANATILGGKTVVGDGSIIGGNVWLTKSVPPRSVVQFSSRVEQRPADDGLEFHI